MSESLIEAAVAALDGQASFARAIGVPPSLVWQWLNGRRPVAAKHCIAIETATGGAVTRYELRRDVFGDPPTDPQPVEKAA